MTFDNKLKSVLIIESDQGMRTLISNYVKGFGATPVEAASPGPEALNLIDNNVYDLAIIDWKSKSPTGPEIYRMLREHPLNQDMFIIFISGQVTKDDILATIKDPKAKFVVKPFTEEVLFKAVNDFYKGKLKLPNDKSKKISIQKGDGQQKGLDLSIHKTDGRIASGLDKISGEGIDAGFNATQSRDLLPTGEDMLVHGIKDEEMVWAEQRKSSVEFEIDNSEDMIGYAEAEGKKGEEGKAAGPAVGVKKPNAFAWDEDEKEMEALSNRFRELGQKEPPRKRIEEESGKRGPEVGPIGDETGKKAPARAVGAAEGAMGPGKKAPSAESGKADEAKAKGQEKGLESPLNKGPNRNLPAADEGKKNAGSPMAVPDLDNNPGRPDGLAAAQKRPGKMEGVADNKGPIGKSIGKASQEKKGAPSSMNAQAPQSKGATQNSPMSDMISDIDFENAPAISDIDDNESEIVYKKKAVKKAGKPIKYGMDQKIHMLNREPGSNSLDVLIIDDDQGLTNLIQNYLAEERSDYVDVCHNAVDGWKAVQKFNYNLIVMDWNSKGLSGLALYNRLRSKPELRRVPVIILTGSMARENFRIIEDNKCTLVLEKPFQLQIFENAVESIRKRQKADSQVTELACQIINMHKGDRKKIYQSLRDTTAKIPCKFDFLLAAGQYLYFLHEYRLAMRTYEDAAKIEPHNVTLMTEMAKVHLRLDHPIESLRLLTEANHFSPGNIERLCLMGEAGLDLFQTDKAQEYFRRALQIDGENLTARQGTIVTNNLAGYLKSVENSKPLREKFASTLNLIGITYIKNNQIKNGIEQYHCAMVFIHDLPTTARIQFNLGLAYFRSGDNRLALEWLNESMKNSDSSFTKPKIWFERIQASKGGVPAMESYEAEPLEWDSDEFVDSIADSLKNMMENPEYD